jgi:pyrroline-5-carboxylate reductase
MGMSVKVVLAGCGHMGYAMLEGWLNSGSLKSSEVFVVEPNAELRGRAGKLGVGTGENAAAILADAPSVVVLAVKPQIIRDVTRDYLRFSDGRTTFVSVAAGTSVATFEEVLGGHAPIIRVMPNTPVAIGEGMMVACANARVSPQARQFVAGLLSASGKVVEIDDEWLMDAVTAVSGSGPAYVYHFIECLPAAGEKAGLPAAIAGQLAMQTVYGSAMLAATSDETPAELRRQVTSPKGTTEAALGVLMGEDRLKKLVGEAVEAARARSVELGK